VWGQSKQSLRLQAVEPIARWDVLELASGGCAKSAVGQGGSRAFWDVSRSGRPTSHGFGPVAQVVQPFGQGDRVSGETEGRQVAERALQAAKQAPTYVGAYLWTGLFAG